MTDEFEFFHSNRYNKIFFGDFMQVAKTLKDGIFDLIFSDPPFGLNNNESLYNRDDSYVIDGYVDVESKDYYEFSRAWILEAVRLLKKPKGKNLGGSIVIISGWTNLIDVMNAAEIAGLYLINHLILRKSFNPPTKHKFVSSHYHMLYYAIDRKKRYFEKPEWKTIKEREAIYHDMHDIWDLKPDYKPQKMKNLNKLPVSLIVKIFKYLCPPNGRVLDPFLGNGSTAEACIEFGAQCIGVEINPLMKPIIEKNVRIALKRKGE